MTIERKNYSGIPVTGSPHFHSVRAGNLLFLAGATAKMTSAENGTMADQTRVILERLKYIMESEGCSLLNVVKMTSYVTDLSESANHKPKMYVESTSENLCRQVREYRLQGSTGLIC